MMVKKTIFILSIFSLLIAACKQNNQIEAQIVFQNKDLKISVDKQLHFNLNYKHKKIPFQTGVLITENQHIKNFKWVSISKNLKHDSIGKYTEIKIKAKDVQQQIAKQIRLKIYQNKPKLIIVNQEFKNISNDTILITGWNALSVKIPQPKDSLFWSFNGSSSEDRSDWILPVKKGFYKENYLGMNNSDYGGGIPVSALWRKDFGVAVGHTSLTPELVSLPIKYAKNNNKAELSINKKLLDTELLAPNQKIDLLETFIDVYHGDCFKPLQDFSKYMKEKGLQFAPTEESAFEPIWCAWGYERNFTIDEIINTLPKVKELGFKWVVIDDGYQIEEGNWHVNQKTFPKGDQQMKELVDKIHSYGLKAKIWWTPLAIDMLSPKLKEHPEVLLRNANESPQYITWWDAFYMSPSHPQTIKETKEAIDLFIDQWGFDGFKMDGQHLNAIPPDYNRDIKDPEQAVRDLPNFFKMIYDNVRKKKPNAVIENCPCGDCMSFYNMTSINQAVSSDPESSWQIRTKGKVYKALIPQTAYYGDHVELSDNANDFASSFGVGAVLGSKFTWPKDNPTVKESFVLTSEKEQRMKKWLDLYQQKMLSKGTYLGNLYDIGFDRPETHVIRKNDTLYYAFYADNFNGKITLRGLKDNIEYQVYDYFNNQNYPDIKVSNPKLKVSFKQFLLLEVKPKK